MSKKAKSTEEINKRVNGFYEHICPSEGMITQNEEGTLVANILDGETDTIKCKFNYDDCVELNTARYKHITLSRENLVQLIGLIDKAEQIYDDMDDES